MNFFNGNNKMRQGTGRTRNYYSGTRNATELQKEEDQDTAKPLGISRSERRLRPQHPRGRQVDEAPRRFGKLTAKIHPFSYQLINIPYWNYWTVASSCRLHFRSNPPFTPHSSGINNKLILFVPMPDHSRLRM